MNLEQTLTLLPANRALKALVVEGPAFFRDIAADGSERLYTVTPMIEDVFYAMAVWPRNAGLGKSGLWQWTLPTVILPFLMWVISLIVAFVAVHRLVIRHIRRLRKRMRLFSRFRRVENEGETEILPAELREVTDSFVSMAHTILRDEAEQENSLREKDALLREVYHRVRNNLQLITSINNMQIRAVRSREAKNILRRLQDRITALATIHGALYEANTFSKVRADSLVNELVSQVTFKAADLNPNVRVETHTDPVMLHPDQAVPLALFVVEALTNAVRHLGLPDQETVPRLQISLRQEPSGAVRLEISNTIGPQTVVDLDEHANTGLGVHLMDAFVTQLQGEKSVSQTGDHYDLLLRFEAVHFDEGRQAELTARPSQGGAERAGLRLRAVSSRVRNRSRGSTRPDR